MNYYKSDLDKKENSILMANAQLGIWTHIMLHELKHYIGGISNPLIEISELLEKSEVPEQLKEYFKDLDNNYQKISSVIDAFRERMDPTHNISINRIRGSYFNNVENILPISYFKTGSSIHIRTKNNLPDNFCFFSEKFYIEHILMNLIKNAVEAIREKQEKEKRFEGKITIFVRYMDSSDQIKFTVEDNGPGFPKKMRSDHITPFCSTRKGNIRGLGMYICKEFVKTLNGSMTIKSGKNGNVSFCIPARRKGGRHEK